MEKLPSDRFHSAEELSEVLSLCLAHVQRPASCRLPAEVIELDARARDKVFSQRLLHPGGWLVAIGVVVAAIVFATPWLSSKLANRENSILHSEPTNVPPHVEGTGVPSERNSKDLVTSQQANAPQPVIRGPKQLGPPEASEVVRHKLTTPTTVTLDGVTLGDGVAEILKASSVGFTLNEMSLKSENVDLAYTQSLSGSGTTFEILKRFLGRFRASFIVNDTQLEIVAADYAQQHPVLRYYELSLIQPGNQSLPAIVVAIEQCGETELWSSIGGGPFTISQVDSVLLVKADESTHHQVEQLLSQLNLIRQH